MPAQAAELPIIRRFPGLASIPRAELGTYPTPVDRVLLPGGRSLLVKRDDRSASPVGGNKVRGLEWLLGGLSAGDAVLTVGPRGSTHALATAIYARRLGAHVTVVRWNQEMNPAARRCAAQLNVAARVIDARWVSAAYAIATSMRGATKTRWIPAGGAATIALLGHVNAALELAAQVDAGECVCPTEVYVPLGTGGTAAGLALGFRIAGLPTRLVAVRVVPRLLGRAGRVAGLANRAARFIERIATTSLPRIAREDIRVEHAYYGGGYARPLRSTEDTLALDAIGIRLDDTYSRKTFAAALAASDATPLLWLTFDGRLLQDGG